jgi:hypothetical protein
MARTTVVLAGTCSAPAPPPSMIMGQNPHQLRARHSDVREGVLQDTEALLEQILADHQRWQEASTFPKVPQVSTTMPALWQCAATVSAVAASGSSVPGRLSSTATIALRPRTSAMTGKAEASLASRGSMTSPIRRARLGEDVVDVLFDRAGADHQGRRDRGFGPSLGHQGEHGSDRSPQRRPLDQFDEDDNFAATALMDGYYARYPGRAGTPPGGGDLALQCLAVGFTGFPAQADVVVGHTLIEHWNGKTWTRVPSPNPPGSSASSLRAVTAVSSANAWAVGIAIVGDLYKTLAMHWDGRHWTMTPSPTPLPNGTLDRVAASWINNI